MIDARERSIFDRAKALLEEIETLKADLKQLRADAEEEGLSKERIADLVAVAKDAIADQVKRARKDEQRARRAELEGQLSMLPAEPKKRALAEGRSKIDKAQTVTQATVAALETINALDALKAAAEPPHDPDTGEVIEDGEAKTAAEIAVQGGVTTLREGDVVSASGDLPAYVGAENVVIATATIEPEHDLAAARRASFDDDLEIPAFARRGHPDCAVGKVPEAAE